MEENRSRDMIVTTIRITLYADETIITHMVGDKGPRACFSWFCKAWRQCATFDKMRKTALSGKPV